MGGLSFQALFRNPLATPYTLGIAGGASLGAGLFIKLSIPALTLFAFQIDLLPFAAFLGAICSMLLVYFLAKWVSSQGMGSSTLLLAGVSVSFFFSSLLMFAQFLADYTESFLIIRWLMGGLEIIGYSPLLHIAPFILPGVIILASLGREFDQLLGGEAMALSRGVNIHKVRKKNISCN